VHLPNISSFAQANLSDHSLHESIQNFDFILKRTLRHPETQQKLPTDIFMMNEKLNVL
jgi:hypothetical protein